MKHNVKMCDRVIHLIAGCALLSLTVLLEGGVRWLGLVGIVPILTALFGFCPRSLSLKMGTTECCAPKEGSQEGGVKKEGGSCCGGGCHSGDTDKAV